MQLRRKGERWRKDVIFALKLPMYIIKRVMPPSKPYSLVVKS
jgi:hypothetical protein